MGKLRRERQSLGRHNPYKAKANQGGSDAALAEGMEESSAKGYGDGDLESGSSVTSSLTSQIAVERETACSVVADLLKGCIVKENSWRQIAPIITGEVVQSLVENAVHASEPAVCAAAASALRALVAVENTAATHSSSSSSSAEVDSGRRSSVTLVEQACTRLLPTLFALYQSISEGNEKGNEKGIGFGKRYRILVAAVSEMLYLFSELAQISPTVTNILTEGQILRVCAAIICVEDPDSQQPQQPQQLQQPQHPQHPQPSPGDNTEQEKDHYQMEMQIAALDVLYTLSEDNPRLAAQVWSSPPFVTQCQQVSLQGLPRSPLRSALLCACLMHWAHATPPLHANLALPLKQSILQVLAHPLLLQTTMASRIALVRDTLQSMKATESASLLPDRGSHLWQAQSAQLTAMEVALECLSTLDWSSSRGKNGSASGSGNGIPFPFPWDLLQGLLQVPDASSWEWFLALSAAEKKEKKGGKETNQVTGTTDRGKDAEEEEDDDDGDLNGAGESHEANARLLFQGLLHFPAQALGILINASSDLPESVLSSAVASLSSLAAAYTTTLLSLRQVSTADASHAHAWLALLVEQDLLPAAAQCLRCLWTLLHTSPHAQAAASGGSQPVNVVLDMPCAIWLPFLQLLWEMHPSGRGEVIATGAVWYQHAATFFACERKEKEQTFVFLLFACREAWQGRSLLQIPALVEALLAALDLFAEIEPTNALLPPAELCRLMQEAGAFLYEAVRANPSNFRELMPGLEMIRDNLQPFLDYKAAQM
jgi:hypothetical protein